jgi:anti-sigma-K factor RskA
LNIKEYISSGILEAYALGELSADEMAEVEKNVLQYPELKAELRQIEEAQETLLLKTAIQPRASVKGELFKKLDQGMPQGKAVTITGHRQIRFWRYATAASVALALLSSYMAYTYYGNWRRTQSNLSELLTQNQRIAQDYNTVNQRLEKLETDLRITGNPSFSRVVMKGTANAPDALASVYWNASTKEVYLSIQNLKTLSQENQYQLWAIVDGKPIDAGVFDAVTGGLVKMKMLDGATAFAVTIEPRGGRTSPTLETMQVIGNVVKG